MNFYIKLFENLKKILNLGSLMFGLYILYDT